MGLTRGTKREHIIRAAQESIAYQVADLAEAMEADTGLALSVQLKADGGASRDTFLMQFQADILDRASPPPRHPGDHRPGGGLSGRAGHRGVALPGGGQAALGLRHRLYAQDGPPRAGSPHRQLAQGGAAQPGWC